MKNEKRVILGMSGGTDSSVSAMRLQAEGYEVIGVTFRFYEPDGRTSYLEEARSLADALGIRHIVCDLREEFRKTILSYFISSYMKGETPVPCTLCNHYFKWPMLLKIADEEDAQWVATGHYVQKVLKNGKYYISPARDRDKDQTFFMWGLKQNVLERMLLPMGGLLKSEARQYAAERGFQSVSTKHDSLGICFCPSDYREFLRKEVEPSLFPGRGRFVDEEGNFLGWHEGYPFYTIGQRRGLGIYLNRAVFVKTIDVEKNEITLSPLQSLYKDEMLLRDWNLVDPDEFFSLEEVIVKIRYRKQANRCKVSLTAGNRLHVLLLEPLEAIASGQAAAFYDTEGLLLGGGIII